MYKVKKEHCENFINLYMLNLIRTEMIYRVFIKFLVNEKILIFIR